MGIIQRENLVAPENTPRDNNKFLLNNRDKLSSKATDLDTKQKLTHDTRAKSRASRLTPNGTGNGSIVAQMHRMSGHPFREKG
jgi:hypothetical protein